MKRKTFTNLRTAALGMLLLEAMLLLVLLLIHTGASAEDSGFFGAHGEAAGFGDTASGSGAPNKSNENGPDHHGGSHHYGKSAYLCDGHDASCLTGGDTVNAFESYGGRGQDFTGSGGGKSGGGNGASGNDGSGQDSTNWNRPAWGFFPGGGGAGAGGGGFGSGNSGEGKPQSGGQGPDEQDAGQNTGQNDGQNDKSKDGNDGDGGNTPAISSFLSVDDTVAGDPPPGAGDPPVNNDPNAPTPVPEPMTGSLLAAGLTTILVLRRRRRH